MDSNQRMIAWSSAWALAGGQVVCTGCMRGQSISLNEDVFPHEPGCKAKGAVAETPGLSCIRYWIYSAASRCSKDGLSTPRTTGQLREKNPCGIPVRPRKSGARRD